MVLNKRRFINVRKCLKLPYFLPVLVIERVKALVALVTRIDGHARRIPHQPLGHEPSADHAVPRVLHGARVNVRVDRQRQRVALGQQEDIGEDDEVFAVALVLVQVRVAETHAQVFQSGLLHLGREQWADVSLSRPRTLGGAVVHVALVRGVVVERVVDEEIARLVNILHRTGKSL